MDTILKTAAAIMYYRFCDKNTSLLTLSGLSKLLSGVTIFPEALKTCSEAELVAHIAKYFFTGLANMG